MDKKLIISLIFLLFANSIFATTWDEPWRKNILQKSEHFILGKVVHTTDSIITLEVEKDFDGNIKGQIRIDNFFLLDLCSWSPGHDPAFHFEEDMEGYFFLKKGKNGNYQLPTPTSGVDRIVEDKVHATYRHSYHQAAVSKEDYELTYHAIWNYYRGKDFDEKDIFNFIYSALEKEPVGLDEPEVESEIATFFEQHAALESAYLLGIDLDFRILKKFVEFDYFHVQVSGLRAMGVINSPKSNYFLIEYIKKAKSENFTTVIAIWSLWEAGNKKYKRKIWRLRKEVSNEETSFGGSIMDPRVCTYFPSPKKAIIDLKKKGKKVN